MDISSFLFMFIFSSAKPLMILVESLRLRNLNLKILSQKPHGQLYLCDELLTLQPQYSALKPSDLLEIQSKIQSFDNDLSVQLLSQLNFNSYEVQLLNYTVQKQGKIVQDAHINQMKPEAGKTLPRIPWNFITTKASLTSI